MKLHSHALIPSLDGIRAVSIAIVFFAHAGVSRFLPGGFGVTIFFFLSGYLITSLFYREAEKTGRIDMKAFYLRRLLRLSPPLFGTLAITYTLVALGVFEGRLDPGAMLSQALYLYNYYVVFDPNSTEGALGLNVLWSLSVEEHFYLIYPWMFVALLAGRLRISHVVALLGAILIWRFIRLLWLGADPNDIYISTDTRFDSILYGALLAMLQAKGVADRIFPQDAKQRALILAAAFSVLILCLLLRDATFRETLRYSLQGIALMPVFYYAVTRPDMLIFRPLNWAPMRLLGFYSYTIYLAHTVVLGNLEASGLAPHNKILFALVAGAICVVYAMAMYRFIETPVKKWRRRQVAS